MYNGDHSSDDYYCCNHENNLFQTAGRRSRTRKVQQHHPSTAQAAAPNASSAPNPNTRAVIPHTLTKSISSSSPVFFFRTVSSVLSCRRTCASIQTSSPPSLSSSAQISEPVSIGCALSNFMDTEAWLTMPRGGATSGLIFALCKAGLQPRTSQTNSPRRVAVTLCTYCVGRCTVRWVFSVVVSPARPRGGLGILGGTAQR